MNLGAVGGLAGGVASGYETQQKIAQHQQELNDSKNFRDRQMAMAEQNQAWTEEQHNQQRAMQTDMQTVNDSYLKPQTTQNPDGTTSTVPPLDMNDPSQGARRLSYMTDMLGVKMKHTMDPTQLAPIMDYLDKARGTQFGQDVLGAMSGDQNKLNSIVTKMGGDPAKASIDHDNMTLDLGNGKPPVDLQQYMLMGGAEKALNGVVALRKANRQDTLTDAQVEHLGSQSNLQDTQATQLVPAQAALARAHAGYFSAKGAAAGGDTKQGAATVKEYTSLSKANPIYDPVGDPNTGAKNVPWNEAEGLRLSLFSQARQGGKDSAAAMAQSTKTVNDVSALADQQAAQVVKSLKSGALTKDNNPYGTTKPAAIKKAIFNKLVAKNFPGAATAVPQVAAPAASRGNLTMDDYSE